MSAPTRRVGGRDALGAASCDLALVGAGVARGVGADGGSGVVGDVGVGAGVEPGVGVAVGAVTVTGGSGAGPAVGAGSVVGGWGVGVAVGAGDSESGEVATSAPATAVSRPGGAITPGTCDPAPARPPV